MVLSPLPSVVPLTYRPSFSPSPSPSSALKLRFFLFEALFVAILLYAVPVGAHGTVVSISIGNLFAVAWFWYNSVRCVDVTANDGLRFASRVRRSRRGRGARGGRSSGWDRCDARG